MSVRIYILSLALLLCPIAAAQEACPPVQPPAVDSSKIFFTPQQETELGDIIRQQFDRDFQVIEDPQVTSFLSHIGRQVARHLPDTGLHYDFLLYDRPEVQAFSAPGGRVYVSRKLVAFLKSEDELAGLLGHEMGHLAARQQALELSLAFKDILGLKSVSENDDLFALYNQLLERARLKNRHTSSSQIEEKGQAIADQLGVQAVARAGYSPQAFPSFLDRLMQTKGNKGTWLTDLFGATKPDSRRLREALKDVSSLPQACMEAPKSAGREEFQRWQSAVLHYTGIGHAEKLSGVVSRRSLSNPLRGDIEHFRFSPSGKYLLAQDDSGIYVLTRDPFKFLFRFDAPDAQAAQFSPDSRQVVFFSSYFRVETWDVERQEQVSVTDVPALHGCRESALSPDAKFLACFDSDMTLTLFDVASGETLFQKEHFFEFESAFNPYAGLFRFLYMLTHPEIVVLRFSPDAHFFAASSRTGGDVVYDLNARKKINVPGTIHTLMEYSFTFLAPDRIVGLDRGSPNKSPVAEFPTGKILDRVPLGGGAMVASSNPDYILLRPVINYPVGAYSLKEKKITYTNRTTATDVFADELVSERLNGEIGLYKMGDSKDFSVVQLPLGKLGGLRASSVSPDLKYMAISTRTRGGIWNLDSNQRVLHTRSFQSAHFNPNATFFIDFPSFEKTDRELVVASPVTAQSKGRPVDKDDHITFFGDVLFRIKAKDKNLSLRRNIHLEALDIVDQKPLWSRDFSKLGPTLEGSPSSGRVVFLWRGPSDGFREEIALDARLRALAEKRKLREGDCLLEVLDSRSGAIAGGAILGTGNFSFVPRDVQAVGDWLVVEDNTNRVLLYSVSTGEQLARWFGNSPTISRNGRRLSLANGRGHLTVYDLQALKRVSDFYFANPVSMQAFSGDGAKLLVLTNDQTAFELDLGSESNKTASN